MSIINIQSLIDEFISTILVSVIFFIIAFISSIIINFMRGNKLFLSVPIASILDDIERNKIKEQINSAILKIESKHKLKVYCAYVKLPGKFDPARKSAIGNFSEIRRCKYFAAILPEKLPTSSYIEIGYALAKKKNVMIYHKDDSLPFLIKDIETNGIPLLPGRILARRTTVNSLDDALDRLVEEGVSEFPGLSQRLLNIQKK